MVISETASGKPFLIFQVNLSYI